MKIIAHRGDSASAPENTMKAFRMAWTAGADGVELDVRLSADGEVVVFHDPDGRRRAGDPRSVAECAWAELRQWKIAGEPIPRLAEVLAEAPDASLILIEIKSGPEIVAKLTELFKQYADKSIVLLAFAPETAAAARRACTFPVWLNVEAKKVRHMESIMAEARAMGLAGLSLGWSWRLGRSLIKRIQQAGWPVAVWTVNRPAVGLKLQEWGVEMVMTDHPRRMLSRVRHHA